MTEQDQNLSYSILSMMIHEYFQTLTTFPHINIYPTVEVNPASCKIAIADLDLEESAPKKQSFLPYPQKTCEFLRRRDFCNQWENLWQKVLQLPSITGERRSTSRMHLSEVMTIVIAFHGSGYKTIQFS